MTAGEKKGLAALVDQQLQGQGLQAQYARLVQLAADPDAGRALIEKANQAPPN